MTKRIFQDSFLISGIMCFDGCGSTVQGTFTDYLIKCKELHLVPEDTQLIMDAEPSSLGIHRVTITLTSNDETWALSDKVQRIYSEAKKDLAIMYPIGTRAEEITEKGRENGNWLNILINLLSCIIIFTLSSVLTPSIALTIGLTGLSFLTTAFTARKYLLNFFYNLRHQNLSNMTTTVSLGWLLSLAHTLYHSITMPMANSFSMVFMCFIMPVLLITVINVMDEIKRQIVNKSQKMHLKGINMLFPEMSKEYTCYDPEPRQVAKNLIKQGMVIQVKTGECFPIDCELEQGQTVVNESLLTGEPFKTKIPPNLIRAGAINLGTAVRVRATKDSYNSTVNMLLFESYIPKQTLAAKPPTQFAYIYTTLLLVGVATSILAPLCLGILTVPVLLQNVTGILFAVCPCTIAIADQLPNLLNLYRRACKGIGIRDEAICQESNEIHTVVFDKTGTLTTGNSEVESHEGISNELWERVYLLESQHGNGHPLAKAITSYYAPKMKQQSIFKDIYSASSDINNRGLSALVQGRKIHIGSAAFLKEAGITNLPITDSAPIARGLTAIYVAEDNVYKGVIYIKHEIRKDIQSALSRLIREGKKIIMLTGDTLASAIGFNAQNGNLFEKENIKAGQTPKEKKAFVEQLMAKDNNPKGIWFIGDGLNDAPCANAVSQKGGISCAMNSDDKTSFFSDMSLNGSLSYLFEHNKLNQFLQKNILQNQGLLIYGTIAFIAFILSFSISSIAVSPMIPLLVMASTTLMILFNSYRVGLAIDNALDPNPSWIKQTLASDVSLGLLVSASILFMCSLLLSTIATAGAATVISSICLFSSEILIGLFSTLAISYFFVDEGDNVAQKDATEISRYPAIERMPLKIVPTTPPPALSSNLNPDSKVGEEMHTRCCM